jgi:hypothetical protein
MNNGRLLTIASVLTLLLLNFHLTDDIVHGFEPGGLSNLFGSVAISVIWLSGALLLRERLAGYIITLLGGLLSLFVAYAHMKNGVGEIAKAGGGFFFVWTLLAAATIGIFSAVLSLRGLWGLLPKKSK